MGNGIDPVVHEAQQAAFRQWRADRFQMTRDVIEATQNARLEMADYLCKAAAKHGVGEPELARHLDRAAQWTPKDLLPPGTMEDRARHRAQVRPMRMKYETSQL